MERIERKVGRDGSKIIMEACGGSLFGDYITFHAEVNDDLRHDSVLVIEPNRQKNPMVLVPRPFGLRVLLDCLEMYQQYNIHECWM